MFSKSSQVFSHEETQTTLLGSGSESPNDEALLLTTVSYLKNKQKLKYKREKDF